MGLKKELYWPLDFKGNFKFEKNEKEDLFILKSWKEYNHEYYGIWWRYFLGLTVKCAMNDII